MRPPSFPFGVMFHRIHREGEFPKGLWSVSNQQCEEIIRSVGLGNILTPEEWVAKVETNSLESNDRCITFDDGLKGQFDWAVPVLESLGIKAFFFVYSSVFENKVVKTEIYNQLAARFFNGPGDYYEQLLGRWRSLGNTLDIQSPTFRLYHDLQRRKFPFYSTEEIQYRFLRDNLLSRHEFESFMDDWLASMKVDVTALAQDIWMTEADLKDLVKNGHCIGLHSYDHPVTISRLSREGQENQYRRNLEHLKRLYREGIKTMAHPCGMYNNETLSVLKSLGITCGFRSTLTPPVNQKVNASRLELAREDCSNIYRQIVRRSA